MPMACIELLSGWRRRLSDRVISYAILIWIGGAAAFFYARFTLAFVYANADAIRSLLDW